LVALIIIVFAISLFYLPYAGVRSQTFGKSAVVVDVVGIQWAWSLSTNQVPLGLPVEFNVTSHDVNHDFGIFNSQGVLVGQVQALPGYYNQLIIVFNAPGTYTVRCLDFCGPGHAFMTLQFTVT
jgi:cytochrome c oxidase subunit 2